MRKSVLLCAATVLSAGGIATAPGASAWMVAGSGCVRSGQTEEYCIGRFIETINTAAWDCDAECQPTAVKNGLGVVDSMVRSFNANSGSLPPDKMFWDCVAHIREADPWVADWQAEGFVRASIHWFGPPGMEEAVNQIVPGSNLEG